MSAVLYDEALLNKIKNWVKDPNMTITGPNETRRLFEYKADVTNDKPIQLPLIALRRDSSMTILNTNKKPQTFDGFRQNASFVRDNNPELGGKVDQFNSIPIQLNYQIDIYTRYYEEAEEYVRDFIFNLINYPTLYITIPYNSCNKKMQATINLSPTVEDNSDISERLTPGQFTRKTISIYIADAYLWNYAVKDTIKIGDVDVELKCKLINNERDNDI